MFKKFIIITINVFHAIFVRNQFRVFPFCRLLDEKTSNHNNDGNDDNER